MMTMKRLYTMKKMNKISLISLVKTHMYSSSINNNNSNSNIEIEISHEVKNALALGQPIVALESTIITHGMPYPKNLEVAKAVEKVVRDHHCIPATIAIINGIPKIGLNENDLLLLSQADHTTVIKASRRDISYAISNRLSAGTTVAGTLTLAHLIGLKIFATGGIGGVHRGAELTMDISADLQCLSQIPITTVCAGIKSILDVTKSLEVLETLSVPVISLRSETFPTFFTNDSNIKSPYNVQHEKDIAKMMMINNRLGLQSGMIIAAPNPNPGDSVAIQSAIDQSLDEAAKNNIYAARLTPFVLERVKDLTQGKSLDANISLVLNNAKVASEIAIEYYKLTKSNNNNITTTNNSNINVDYNKKHSDAASVVVVGGAVADFISKIETKTLLGSSNPGTMSSSYGGVGRNVAQCIGSKGINVKLLSVVGNDNVGKGLIADTSNYGVDVSGISVIDKAQTASYTAIHDNTGDLALAVADMNIFTKIDEQYLNRYHHDLISSKIIVIDGNISYKALTYITSLESNTNRKDSSRLLIFEPTSDHKCLLPFLQEPILINHIDVIKPNLSELKVMLGACFACFASGIPEYHKYEELKTSDRIDDIGIMASILLNTMEYNNNDKCKHVLVSLGKQGILWCTRSITIKEIDHYKSINERYNYAIIPSLPIHILGNTNGAGDSFLGGFIAYIINNNKNDNILDNINITSIQAGLLAAKEKLLLNNQQKT